MDGTLRGCTNQGAKWTISTRPLSFKSLLAITHLNVTPCFDVMKHFSHAFQGALWVRYPNSKCSILLTDLSPRGEVTMDLFAPAARARSDKLMAAVDAINKREGRGTVRLGRVPVDPDWGMKREMKSRYFTTRWDEVIGVRG